MQWVLSESDPAADDFVDVTGVVTHRAARAIAKIVRCMKPPLNLCSFFAVNCLVLGCEVFVDRVLERCVSRTDEPIILRIFGLRGGNADLHGSSTNGEFPLTHVQVLQDSEWFMTKT
jgi:hypothetical protein